MKQKVLLLIVCGVVLSACTSSGNGANNLSNQPSPTPAVKGASDSSIQKNEQQVVTNLGSPIMKQIADFPPNKAAQATITTTKGDIKISLYRDAAPLTTLNFITLASSGFYDGIVFHRVIPGFMAQVGDPTSKDPNKKASWGTGGPGYVIADEFGPNLKHDKAGVVSMANAGPNTGGSQFFITHEETPWLDGKHAIFGQVIEGMEIVLKLEVGDSITKITLQ